MRRLLVTLLVVASVGSTQAKAQETITARAKLKDAIAEAKKWQPDAVLRGVSAAEAKPDGSAVAWTYGFQSKTSKTCYNVVALASRMIGTEIGGCRDEPVSEDFVDSPAALKSAIGGGFQAGETFGLNLHYRNDRNLPAPRECWDVYSPEKDFDQSKAVMRGWCVDPRTGKFVGRLAGEAPGGKKR